MTTTESATGGEARRTRQRDAVRAYLTATSDFATAQQIHDRLLQLGQVVSLPTVYRTLAAMADSGEVDQLTVDGATVYRRCSRDHHHHLVCRRCGRTIEINGPPVESWARDIARRYGFDQVRHITELSGICPACRAG